MVFSRAPAPGRTKSRLQARLLADECALFHRACLQDLHLLAGRTGMKAFLYFTGGRRKDFCGDFSGCVPAGFEELRRLRLDGFEFRQQQGEDLGERLCHAAGQVLRQHDRALLIGSDLPDLAPELLRAAVGQLDGHDLALGRTADQGYYLLGLKEARRELFRGIDWGTSRVWSQTLQAASRMRLDVACLPERRDIDTWDDLVDYVHRGKWRQELQGMLSYRLAARLVCEKEELDPGGDRG